MIEIEDGIYSFEIILPDNPLKWLNCYVIKGRKGERNLLIDSGFHREECTRALFEGIAELGLTPADTDVFFTHLHSDHTGNGFELYKRGYKIMMGRIDYNILFSATHDSWVGRGQRLGIPSSLLEKIIDSNPGFSYAPQKFDAQFVNDGDVLEYGGRKLRCMHLPGHTPGLLCLYDSGNKVFFSSDHVLFDIAPNIVSWKDFNNSLGGYIEGLERVREMDIGLCLPAHRTDGGKSAKQRADEIISHHIARLNETLSAAESMPGSTAYDLAGYVRWNIRAKSWEEFPLGQKWFAIGETLAHLEYLQLSEKLRMEIDHTGAYRYYPV